MQVVRKKSVMLLSLMPWKSTNIGIVRTLMSKSCVMPERVPDVHRRRIFQQQREFSDSLFDQFGRALNEKREMKRD